MWCSSFQDMLKVPYWPQEGHSFLWGRGVGSQCEKIWKHVSYCLPGVPRRVELQMSTIVASSSNPGIASFSSPLPTCLLVLSGISSLQTLWLRNCFLDSLPNTGHQSCRPPFSTLSAAPPALRCLWCLGLDTLQQWQGRGYAFLNGHQSAEYHTQDVRGDCSPGSQL